MLLDFIFKNNTQNNNCGKLTYYHQYESNHNYSTITKVVKCSSDKLLKIFKKNIHDNKSYVNIESKFNSIYYPMFDLDNLDKLEEFKKIYCDTPYIIFVSSNDKSKHYWAFLDVPYTKLEKLFSDYVWLMCNDENYVKFSKSRNNLFIRGLFENKNRLPYKKETNGNISENLNNFITKIEDFYNNIGFELSILRYKDPDMLFKFTRKKKLDKIKLEC